MNVVITKMSESKSLFKYRSGDQYLLKTRYLPAIEQNYFWSASINSLNDPCEATYVQDDLLIAVKRLEQFKPIPKLDRNWLDQSLVNLSQAKNRVGVFSLSKTPSDELLWAHYANSHNGFCTEYDLTELINPEFVSAGMFDVTYDKKPPGISNNHLKSNTELTKRVLGYKSQRWAYEEETRIVTESQGRIHHNYKALKAIYFGVRFDPIMKELMLRKLAGRGIQYYQMKLQTNSYQLIPQKIEDPFIKTPCFWSNTVGKVGQPSARYLIEKYSISIENKKAMLFILLENEVDRLMIAKIAKQLRESLFYYIPRSYIYFYVKGLPRECSWATAHTNNGKTEVQIGAESV